MGKVMTGNEDQRFVNRDDHDAAKRWFTKTYKEKNRFTWEERQANVRRLVQMIENVLEGKVADME